MKMLIRWFLSGHSVFSTLTSADASSHHKCADALKSLKDDNDTILVKKISLISHFVTQQL